MEKVSRFVDSLILLPSLSSQSNYMNVYLPQSSTLLIHRIAILLLLLLLSVVNGFGLKIASLNAMH